MSLRETYQSRKNLLAANLTQQGVTASGSEGLTTLINKVLEISPAPPTPVLDHFDVELIDGKKILSYADEQQTPYSQFASLLFTAYDSNDDPIPGLEFDFSVTGESTVSAVCDNSGEYVYTYYSQGIGDVEITASKEVGGTVVSKTYIRDDLFAYQGTVPSNYPDTTIQLPSAFEIKATFTRTGSSNASAIFVGTNGTRNSYIGQYSSSGDYGIFFLSPNNPQRLASSSTNSPYTLTIQYKNGEYTMTDGTNTKTVSDFTITSVYVAKSVANCSVADVEIKPL